MHQQANLAINSVNSANDQVVKISNNDTNIMKITNHILTGFTVYCRERNACLYSKHTYQLKIGEIVSTRGEPTPSRFC